MTHSYQMDNTTYTTTLCRGLHSGDCPYVLETAPGLEKAVQQTIEQTGWSGFLLQRLNRPKHHQRLKISLAGCANGCSQPQVADIALIRTRTPLLDPDACTGCGLCQEACPEQPDRALSMTDRGPVFHLDKDMDKCLRCGICARACPEQAIGASEDGFRLLFGGRLGRRPRLADEYPDILSLDQALVALKWLTLAYMERHETGLRLADLVRRDGTKAFVNAVKTALK